jgi:hypothetical protein
MGLLIAALLAFLLAPAPFLTQRAAREHASQKPSASGRKAAIYPVDPRQSGPAWFVDVSRQAGLMALDVNGGESSKRYIIETTGSGVAVIDYDRDGWPDIYVANGAFSEGKPSNFSVSPTGHLYHNNHDGTFTDVTHKAGLVTSGWGQGACVGDYDNDGWDDLYLTFYGTNRLFHNNRDGTFREVAQEAGVAGTGKQWGTGCAFVDYDRDGRLDIMVANYVRFDEDTAPKPGEGQMCVWKGTPVMCGPRGLPYTTNTLFHNEGSGRFSNATMSSGIAHTDGHYCFSVSTLDYNDDGWPDLYLACDSTPSILYRNNKNGTYTDVGADAGAAFDEDGREQAGMGSTVGDFDGDGLPDIFKTNFSDDTSSLYRNNGNGTFTSRIFEAGLGLNTKYLGWGVMFVDVNNDGWPDLLLANGHVYPEVDTAHLGSSYEEPRLLYLNLGNKKFQDISRQAGPGLLDARSGRGLAVADFWNDGRISAVVNNMGAIPALLVNVAPHPNHWLGLRLRGTQSNADGIGARVTLVGSDGRRYVQEVRSGSSYNSSSDLRLHFGLGTANGASTIDVRWPSGFQERFTAEGSDRIVMLTEGTGESRAAKATAR